MQISSCIQQRPTGYYYRQIIPLALRYAFGQTEIVRSLKTKSLRIAKERAIPLMASVYEVFTHLREMTSDISHEQAEAIAESWKRTVLNDDFDRRITGERSATGSAKYAGQIATTHRKIKASEFDLPTEAVKHLADHHQLHLPEKSQSAKRLSYYILKARIEYLEELERRASPDTPHLMAYMKDTTVEAVSVKVDVGESENRLSEMCSKWAEESTCAAKTITEWRASVRRFIELKGDIPVKTITRADIRDFRDACKEIPRIRDKRVAKLPLPALIARFKKRSVQRITPKTINKVLSGVRTVLDWCVENDYLDQNPAGGVKLKEPRSAKKRRLPFSPEDLKAIFSSPIYTEGRNPKGAAGLAGYWFPLIALYSGMRIEEIGQLLVVDIKQEGDIWYFDINGEDDGEGGVKSLKTASAARRVPVHHVLIKKGFLDYVRKTKRYRSKRLFPHVQSQDDKKTAAFSKWINKHISTVCGVSDPRKVFHSFRHNFKDACREAEIPRDIQNALMGHSEGSVSEGYGMGHSVNKMNDCIQTLYSNDLLHDAAPL